MKDANEISMMDEGLMESPYKLSLSDQERAEESFLVMPSI